jgi:hypothetical protein
MMDDATLKELRRLYEAVPRTHGAVMIPGNKLDTLRYAAVHALPVLLDEIERWRNTAANQMIREAVEHEREKCAQLVESMHEPKGEDVYEYRIWNACCRRLAGEIRARSGDYSDEPREVAPHPFARSMKEILARVEK